MVFSYTERCSLWNLQWINVAFPSWNITLYLEFVCKLLAGSCSLPIISTPNIRYQITILIDNQTHLRTKNVIWHPCTLEISNFISIVLYCNFTFINYLYLYNFNFRAVGGFSTCFCVFETVCSEFYSSAILLFLAVSKGQASHSSNFPPWLQFQS